MRTNDPPTDHTSLSRRLESISFARLLLVGVAVTVGLAALAVGIPWMIALTPRWVVRGASITFLWLLLAGFVVAVPLTLVAGLWSALAAVRRVVGAIVPRSCESCNMCSWQQAAWRR